MKAKISSLGISLWTILAAVHLIALPNIVLADYWESRPEGPGRRVAHTTVFTGTEVIVWGGGTQSIWLNDGGRYNVATGTWSPVSQLNAPSGRWFHAAVWTGKEMIIWGGRANFYAANHSPDGGRYDPLTDTWRPISTVGAPSPRSQLTAIWTGTEMIVWGGAGDNFEARADGARYNPETDTWTPLPPAPIAARLQHTAVWTGTEMIIFGGLEIGAVWNTFGDGARYNPSSNTWTPISSHGAPGSRTAHSAVWSGTEMLVWGGRYLPDYTFWNTGGAYDPAIDSWAPISTVNAPQARAEHAAVWSGTEMIIWGGYIDPSPTEINTGARYNPITKIWTTTTENGAAQKRYFGRTDCSVWTGSAMFVYGGWADYPMEVNSTDLYFPAGGSPPPPPAHGDFWEHRADGPSQRIYETEVFTGDEVIIWGGGRQSTWLNDGARYNLRANTWTPISQVNAPSGRWSHVAVWTGREMIVWGGRANFFSYNHNSDGGAYNPRTDRWRAISTVGAPTPRSQLVAAWTGREMLVWGGQSDGADERNDGGRYNPETDTWSPMAPCPLAGRITPTGIWTGSELIVFGGLKVDNYLSNESWASFGDGARYNPATDRWTLLNPRGAPGSRCYHSAVWTGTEMLIWGGISLPDYSFLNSGACYNPATDSWAPISTQNAPRARAANAAVWSGTEMIIWGGYIDPAPTETDTGARYNPVSRTWTPTTQIGVAQARYFGTQGGLWTGDAMFIYAGWDYPNELNSTYLYYPETISGSVLQLIELLQSLELPRNSLRPLEAALDAALHSLQRGNLTAGKNQLEAFQEKVAAQVAPKNSALADMLTKAAQDIIDRLTTAGN